jgi:hypothetical protein
MTEDEFRLLEEFGQPNGELRMRDYFRFGATMLRFVARLYGCEKFELPNLCAGLHREPLFISAHMSLTTEAHSVVAIYNQPQMATTVIAAVFHDSLGRLWKAWCHPRWRYGESSTHAGSPIQRAPALTATDLLTLTS